MGVDHGVLPDCATELADGPMRQPTSTTAYSPERKTRWHTLW